MAQIQTAEPDVKSLYFAMYLPLISGIFMAVIPDWNPINGLIVFSIVILNCLFVLAMRLTRLIEQSRKRKVIYGITQFNLFVIFLLGVVWRVWGSGLLLGAGLLLLNVVTAYVGYKYRAVIFQEVIYPRTRAGKIIYAAGLIGGGAAGLIGYGLSQVFAERFPNMMPFFVTLVLLPVSIYILLVVYAGWIKAEQPDWKPDTRPARK